MPSIGATEILVLVSPLQFSPVTSLTAAFTTFLTEIFAFIPNLIASLLILLVGYLIVRAVVGALKFGLAKVNLERQIRRTNLGQTIERSGQTISNIVVTAIKWLLYLIVAVYAISALGIPALTASMIGVLGWIPNLVAVVIIVFAGALIASYVGKGIENTLPRYGVTGGRVIGLAVEVLIYAIVFDFALIQIGFGAGIIYTITTALAWGMAAAFAIGFGVAIAFSLRGVLTSMMSGATTIAGSLKEGQKITVEGIPNVGGSTGGTLQGRVRSVGMFTTVLQRDSRQGGGFLILPNDLLMDRPITVEGDEPPMVMEDKMKGRMSDFEGKFEEHMKDRQMEQHT